MPEKLEIDQAANRRVEIGAGALVGFGVIAIVQMLSIDRLDVPLKVAVFSFAVSVPFHAATFMCLLQESAFGFGISSRFLVVALLVGNIASILGIGALF